METLLKLSKLLAQLLLFKSMLFKIEVYDVPKHMLRTLDVQWIDYRMLNAFVKRY